MARLSTIVLTIAAVIFVSAWPAFGQTSAFTYQGKLTDSSLAPTAQYDFIFRLYNGTGTQLGTDLPRDDVQVTNGIFTVSLDFGSANFVNATAATIEIAIRPGASTGAYTTLTPRQPLTSSPYAIKSTNATLADSATSATTALNVTGVVQIANGGTGSPTQNFVDLSTNQTVGGTKTFTGTLAGNGSGLTNLNGANITNNTVNASALASDTFPNNQNLSRLGSLRWDLLGQRVSVGNAPRFAAFDGANIWVTNSNGGNVTKLRAADGAVLGTFPAGGLPFGIAFDGANIWVANQFDGTVTKLRASDGACVGTCTFSTGTSPYGIAFDGANIWVANSGSANIAKLRASDGALQQTVNVGNQPTGVAFDGANIWVTNNGSNSVTKVRASDGAVQGSFTVGSNPRGIAFDGANIWVTNETGINVTKLRASDGACVGTCTFAVGNNPSGIAFDGANIWVANVISNNLTKLRATDGTLLGTFPTGINPFGVVFDGANVWVTNLSGNNVVKLPVFP